MTTLATAFAEVAKLPPDEQEVFAVWILAEVAAEREWMRLFATHPDKLLALAAEALEEDAHGLTHPLDLESL